MENIETLKNKIAEYLASIDMTKLDMQDLNLYVNAVSTINSMLKADYMEELLNMIRSNNFGFGTVEQKPPVMGYGIADAKEAE